MLGDVAWMIRVEKSNRDEFLVIVEENRPGTEHTMTLDEEYCARLTDRKISKEELMRKSFKLLSGREPKESVLCRFNPKVIKRYFPGIGGRDESRPQAGSFVI